MLTIEAQEPQTPNKEKPNEEDEHTPMDTNEREDSALSSSEAEKPDTVAEGDTCAPEMTQLHDEESNGQNINVQQSAEQKVSWMTFLVP